LVPLFQFCVIVSGVIVKVKVPSSPIVWQGIRRRGLPESGEFFELGINLDVNFEPNTK
jgi:hypothetical protein